MHVLLVVPRSNDLRNFESGVGVLLDRGHRVTVAVDHGSPTSGPIVRRLQSRGALHVCEAPELVAPLTRVGAMIRATLDYCHYLQPQFDALPKLRERARVRAPRLASWVTRMPVFCQRGFRVLLHRIEKGLPLPSSVVRFLKEVAPDVLLISPLIYFASLQVWWVRTAARLRIQSIFCVHSWDNLSTKGTFHEVPDHVFVWNETQRTEAAELHGLDPKRCIVTGATGFDHWFTMRPALSREEFLGQLHLEPASAIVLYLCSSRFIAKREQEWVDHWLREVRRASNRHVREAGIIIRPHPQRWTQWTSWRPADPNVCVFPSEGETPIDEAARLRYFHSLYYSDAVVGLNTTALIEASIFGKPVLSVRAPREARMHKTLHVTYLEEGLFSTSPDLAAHIQQLTDALRVRAVSSRSTRFVERFVRPLGIERAAGVEMATAVEELVTRAPGQQHGYHYGWTRPSRSRGQHLARRGAHSACYQRWVDRALSATGWSHRTKRRYAGGDAPDCRDSERSPGG